MAVARQTGEASERAVNADQNRQLRKGEAMPKEESGNDLLGLTEKIVSAHIANNAISSADLPNLIRAVYAGPGSDANGRHGDDRAVIQPSLSMGCSRISPSQSPCQD